MKQAAEANHLRPRAEDDRNVLQVECHRARWTPPPMVEIGCIPCDRSRHSRNRADSQFDRYGVTDRTRTVEKWPG